MQIEIGPVSSLSLMQIIPPGALVPGGLEVLPSALAESVASAALVCPWGQGYRPGALRSERGRADAQLAVPLAEVSKLPMSSTPRCCMSTNGRDWTVSPPAPSWTMT